MNSELVTLRKDYAKKDKELEVMIILFCNNFVEYAGVT